MAFACAHHVRRFGVTPKIALVSHSDFGSADTPSARKMREALRAGRTARNPDFEIDGEMQADTALSLVARARVIADCTLSGEANVLIFPNLDAGSDRAATDPRHRRRAAGRADPRSGRPSPRTCSPRR